MNKNGWLSDEIYILLCVSLAQIITSADNVTTALSIKELMLFFDVNLSTGQIITSFYSVICASLMIISGILGYFFNWKRIFQAGLLFTLSGEIVAIYSNHLVMFVGLSRVLFGIGAALLLPACVSLISTLIREKNRVLAFSIWGTSVAIVIAVFPMLLHILHELFNWRAGYMVLALLSILVFSLSFKMPEAPFEKKCFNINPVEIVLVFFSLMLLLISITLVPTFGFIQPSFDDKLYFFDCVNLPFAIFLLSMLFLFLYCLFKQNNDSNIIPDIFCSKKSLCGFYMLCLLYIIYGGILFIIVSYISLSQYPSTTLALATTLFAISMFISSVTVATIFKHVTSRRLNTVGLIIISISLIVLAIVIVPQSPSYIFYLTLIPIGIGCGLLATKINLVINYSVGEKFASQSSGAQASAKNIGYVLGVISFGMLLTYITRYEFMNLPNTELFLESPSILHDRALSNINFMSNYQLADYFDQLTISYNKMNLSIINDEIKARSMTIVLIIGSLLTLLSIPIGRKVAIC